eukprot:g851.t1
MSRQKFYKDFFNPWESPPVSVSPPGDSALIQRIKKLADYASRNGPEFVTLFKDKQQHNPEYGFLLGGEGHDYYRWCLHCCLTNESMEKGLDGLVSAHKDRFGELLDSLDGSKESIKASQNWFMKNLDLAEDLAKHMYDQIIDSNDITQQIRIFYVIDEILFKSRGTRHDEEHILEIFHPLISPMLSKMITETNQNDETSRRLKKVLNSWYEDGIYDKQTLLEFESTLKPPRSNIQISHNRRRDQDRESHLELKSASSTLPPHIQLPSKFTSSSSARDHEEMSKSGKKLDSVNQTRAAFDPPPSRTPSEKRMYNSFSFPPGLIPKLVSEKGKHSFSYTQISPDDLEKSGQQPILVDANDPYLKSRLQKFYAELDEYRPGMIREHIESRKRNDEVDVEIESQKRRRLRGSHPLTEETKHTSIMPDGSFAGEGSDTMYAGLGARTQSRKSEEDSVFESYRKLRSNVYHNSIPKGPGATRRPR